MILKRRYCKFFHLNNIIRLGVSRGKINDYLAISLVLVSNLILLPEYLRFAIMIAICFLSFLVFITNLLLKAKVRVYILWSGIFILISLIHNFVFPSLTNYAENKQIYFYFVFFSVLFLTSYSNFLYKNYDIVFKGLFFSGLVYFLISIGFKPSEDNIRVNELGLNPLILARNISLLGVLSLFLPNRKYAYIFFICALIGIITTGSRGPILILVFIFLLKFVFERRYFSSIAFIIFWIFIIFFYDSFLKLMPETFSKRITIDAFKYQLESDSGGDRIHLFGLAIDILKDHFLWGVGLGNYSYYAPLNAPHSIYLEIFVEMGIFFFLLFLFFICRSIYCGYFFIKQSNDFRLRGLFFVYLFFVFSMLFDGELTIQSFLLYYLGLLFINLYSYQRKRIVC